MPKSIAPMPSLTGGPSGSPVRLIIPEKACRHGVVSGQTGHGSIGSEGGDGAVDEARVLGAISASYPSPPLVQ